MSSLPSPEGVTRLRELAFEYRKLETEALELSERMRADRTRFEEVKEALTKTRNQLVQQLDNMDCAARGNMGWEGRITWMLSEMTMQGYNAAAVQCQPGG